MIKNNQASIKLNKAGMNDKIDFCDKNTKKRILNLSNNNFYKSIFDLNIDGNKCKENKRRCQKGF